MSPEAWFSLIVGLFGGCWIGIAMGRFLARQDLKNAKRHRNAAAFLMARARERVMRREESKN